MAWQRILQAQLPGATVAKARLARFSPPEARP
jgi:hypothetical protein